MPVNVFFSACLRFFSVLGLSSFVVGCSASAHAQSGCLLELENVKRYANSIPNLLDYAEKRFSSETGEDTSSADRILRPVVMKSFEENSISATLESEFGQESCDNAELGAIGKRIAEADARLSNTDVNKASSNTALSGEKLQKLEALAKSMTLPALAAENAVAGATMNIALKAHFTEKPEVIVKRSGSETEKLAEEAVASLRNTAENLGPFNQQVATANLTAQLTWILSTLPESDIGHLSDFYTSPSTKREQEKLIEIYKREIDQRSSAMLSEFMAAFKQHYSSRISTSNSGATP